MMARWSQIVRGFCVPGEHRDLLVTCDVGDHLRVRVDQGVVAAPEAVHGLVGAEYAPGGDAEGLDTPEHIRPDQPARLNRVVFGVSAGLVLSGGSVHRVDQSRRFGIDGVDARLPGISRRLGGASLRCEKSGRRLSSLDNGLPGIESYP